MRQQLILKPAKWIGVSALTLALFGCNMNMNSGATPTINTNGTPKSIGNAMLYPVENSVATIAYMDPNADFKKYTSVYLPPLNLSQMKVVQPDITEGQSAFALDANDKATIQQAYLTAMSQQLSENNGLTIVTKPDANTLIVATAILQLRPAATNARNQDQSEYSAVFTSSSGGMTLGLVMIDGETGKTIAAADENYIGLSNAQAVNNTSGIRNVTLAFNRIGKQLRNRLDQLISGQ
jgi:hypothetical protein